MCDYFSEDTNPSNLRLYKNLVIFITALCNQLEKQCLYRLNKRNVNIKQNGIQVISYN